MEKDVKITPVIFRKFKKDNQVIALFPYKLWNIYGSEVISYMHTGQKTKADYQICLINSTPARPDEYQDLLKELENLGYNLKIMQRRYNRLFVKNLKTSQGKG